jgi:D-alanyl-D-alanine endopeptidase (penicillin-binding protein 7)
MIEKYKDFLSSFGIMLAGVFLLFFSSLYFGSEKKLSFARFPISDKRTVEGGDVYPQNLPISKPSIPLFNKRIDAGTDISASLTAISSVVLDSKTKAVLFKKNADEVRPLASITKLMTAMVLLDQSMQWDATTEVLTEDIEGDHHIEAGERFTLEDLWNLGLIGSSNSAINVLVRNSGLTKEKFVGLMNQKAADLRLSSARFFEPTGLSEKNVASAMDTAKMLIDALKFDKIYSTVQIGEYYAHPLGSKKARRVWTTNWLLTNWIPNDFKVENIAGKTGYIESSGYNFAVSLSNEKKHVITVVVLGTASNEQRFSEARDLAGWAFAHYLWPDEDGYDELVE